MKQCILIMLALAWTISMDAQGIIRQQTQVKKAHPINQGD